MKFLFAPDFDGENPNWYMIPVCKSDLFYSMRDDRFGSEFNDAFGGFQVDSPSQYTFEDPRKVGIDERQDI